MSKWTDAELIAMADEELAEPHAVDMIRELRWALKRAGSREAKLQAENEELQEKVAILERNLALRNGMPRAGDTADGH